MSGRADGGSGGASTLPPVQERTITDHPITAAQPAFTRTENPEHDGALLWLRQWHLTVGNQTGDKAMDLSELAFRFDVQQAQNLTPPIAVITIYNPPDEIVHDMAKELTFIYLEAGYRTPSKQYGKLFAGEIVYFKYGRQGATDTFVEIHAAQNDQLLTAKYVNTWVPAGATKEDILKTVAQSAYIPLGQITEMGPEKTPRGRALYGMVTDALRDMAATADARCFIDRDGVLHVLGKGESLAMETTTVPILNQKTGLIDIPVQTMGGGVDITCLLNPSLIPGGQVKVDQKDITRFQGVKTDAFIQTDFALRNSEQSLRTDGYYLISTTQHTGETRGNTWYTRITTEPIDPSRIAPKLRTSL
jgi:hypothetical protein